MSSRAIGSLVLFAVTVLLTTPEARAEETFVVAEEGSTAPAIGETRTVTRPNGGMIAAGLVTFGVPYAASVFVAADSGLDADRHLYVPVAGPWMDLANRPDCGIERIDCETETTYKIMLVGDGILQGIGALQFLGGFLFPETRVVATAKPGIRVAPTRFGRGSFGLAAVGRF